MSLAYDEHVLVAPAAVPGPTLRLVPTAAPSMSIVEPDFDPGPMRVRRPPARVVAINRRGRLAHVAAARREEDSEARFYRDAAPSVAGAAEIETFFAAWTGRRSHTC